MESSILTTLYSGAMDAQVRNLWLMVLGYGIMQLWILPRVHPNLLCLLVLPWILATPEGLPWVVLFEVLGLVLLIRHCRIK